MNTYRDKNAFTLIELLVVIAIIGILASVVLSSLNSARAKAKEARVVSNMKNMQSQLALYYGDHGAYTVSSVLIQGLGSPSSFLGNEIVAPSPLNDTKFAELLEEFAPTMIYEQDYDVSYDANYNSIWTLKPNGIKKVEKSDILKALMPYQTSLIFFSDTGQSYTISKTFKIDNEGHHIYCIDGKGGFKKTIQPNSNFGSAITVTYEEDPDSGNTISTDMSCKD